MASKAYTLLFISLILTCMGSVSIPKAEAKYVKYHSCHTVKDCIKDIDCLIAPVQCLESRCTCILISPLSSRKNLNLKPAETPLRCKTSKDCEHNRLICPFGKHVCENSQCHCINAACNNAPESSESTRVVDLLYDTAIISSEFTPDSPAELGNKIYETMAMAVGERWGRVEEEGSSSVDEGYWKDGEAEVVEPFEVRAESDL